MKTVHGRSLPMIAACAIAALLLAAPAAGAVQVPSPQAARMAPHTRLGLPSRPLRPHLSAPPQWVVMAVGGSAARGWDDSTKQGYLARAMNTVSRTLHISIKFWNESVGGFTPERLDRHGYFGRLLKAYKPNIVIISWGLLDDLAAKTPPQIFQSNIRQEVRLATQTKAQVWVVTPPVTEATYSPQDSVLEEVYAGYEINAARMIHPGTVQVFDLLNRMKEYLKQHHQSIQQYADNGWHPNTAGHILAGQLLADAILERRKSLGF